MKWLGARENRLARFCHRHVRDDLFETAAVRRKLREGRGQPLGHCHEGLVRFRAEVQEPREPRGLRERDLERRGRAEDLSERAQPVGQIGAVREWEDQRYVRRHSPRPVACVPLPPAADQRLELGQKDDEGGFGHGECVKKV